jgi:hypothetical protein
MDVNDLKQFITEQIDEAGILAIPREFIMFAIVKDEDDEEFLVMDEELDEVLDSPGKWKTIQAAFNVMSIVVSVMDEVEAIYDEVNAMLEANP